MTIRELIYIIIRRDTDIEINDNTELSAFTTSMGILEILLELEDAGYNTMLIETAIIKTILDLIKAVESAN